MQSTHTGLHPTPIQVWYLENVQANGDTVKHTLYPWYTLDGKPGFVWKTGAAHATVIHRGDTIDYVAIQGMPGLSSRDANIQAVQWSSRTEFEVYFTAHRTGQRAATASVATAAESVVFPNSMPLYTEDSTG